MYYVRRLHSLTLERLKGKIKKDKQPFLASPQLPKTGNNRLAALLTAKSIPLPSGMKLGGKITSSADMKTSKVRGKGSHSHVPNLKLRRVVLYFLTDEKIDAVNICQCRVNLVHSKQSSALQGEYYT